MGKRNPAPEPAGNDGEQGPGFEEALERLETIVEELEGGSLSLEQSIARYEEGVLRLLVLGTAKTRIELNRPRVPSRWPFC